MTRDTHPPTTTPAALTAPEAAALAAHEAVIARGLDTFVDVGAALAAIRDERLYRLAHDTFEEYCRARWNLSKPRAYQLMDAASVIATIQTSTMVDVPTSERHARPLAALPPEQQAPAWQHAVETLPPGERMTAAHVQTSVDAVRTRPAPVFAIHPVASGNRELYSATRERVNPATFNRSNESIDWAWWTWNPVTGCLHDCPYCYARDRAQSARFAAEYPTGFTPTYHPDRLDAPAHTRPPKSADPRAGRVFVCSMADLFGKWVPQTWIDSVFAQVRDNPQWEFLFLTKFPQRLAELSWPDNAWVGTSVDRQHRVAVAEKAFAGVEAGIRWLSCEPMLERLTFTNLAAFDLVVIGGASASTQTDAFTPPAEWVEHLVNQARAAGVPVYFKDNLNYLPKEQPRRRARLPTWPPLATPDALAAFLTEDHPAAD